MPFRHLPFSRLIDLLAQHYGEPAPPYPTEPFAMILWENVAYLASDTKRAAAFADLQAKTGLTPAGIRKAKDSLLLAIAGKGIVPTATVEKLRRAAEIARDSFGDNLAPILDKPVTAAKKDLQKFPGIGEPSAEKILLFNSRYPVLALESNGLRVLVRMGYAPEHKNYSTMYKGVQRALSSQLPADCRALVRAYQLLRLHGQNICKRSTPLCSACPVRANCHFFLETTALLSKHV
jgi:endonuclease-3 related protein